MKGKNSGLLLIKLLIFLLSAGSGFLRAIIAKQTNQLHLVLDSSLIVGYFALPAGLIFIHKGWTLRAQLYTSIAPRFFYFMMHLIFIGYLLLWIYISIGVYGVSNLYALLPSTIDLVLIVLIIANYALDRESPKWLE